MNTHYQYVGVWMRPLPEGFMKLAVVCGICSPSAAPMHIAQRVYRAVVGGEISVDVLRRMDPEEFADDMVSAGEAKGMW